MFTEPTVFVLGAGSSVELGLPDGKSLASQISEKTNFIFDGVRLKKGDPNLYSFCKERQKVDGGNHFSKPVLTGRYINGGLPLAASIDNFIATHIKDADLVELSKAAIVSRILEAEKKSSLYFDYYSNPNNFWDHKTVSNTWLTPFFHKLVEGVKKHEVNNIFENIFIINFNYDRCVEHFLTHALARYFRMETNETLELVNQLWMKRPYGKIAEYNLKTTHGLSFGDTERIQFLGKYFDNIKTFSEEEPDLGTIQEIKEKLLIAKKIVFLGLAFHDANIEYFSLGETGQNSDPNVPKHVTDQSPNIYATAYKQSKKDANSISKILFFRLLRHRVNHLEALSSNIHIREELTCSELLSSYRKSI